jgi:hypothetical protein
MPTLQQLAKEVLLAQDACNLTGIGMRFGKVCEEIRPAMRAAGLPTDTGSVNTHPILVLWVDKMSQLAGIQSEDVGDAANCGEVYNTVQIMAGEPQG